MPNTPESTVATSPVPPAEPQEFANIDQALDAFEQPPVDNGKPPPTDDAVPPKAEDSEPEDEDIEDDAEGTDEDETDESEDEQPEDEDDGEDEQPDGLIPQDSYEDMFIEDAEGQQVSVGELIRGRMMRARFTQGMQELASTRKDMEQQGTSIEHFAAATLNQFVGLINHYRQHWNQLDGNTRQLIEQMTEAVNNTQGAVKTWSGEYTKAMHQARQLQAQDNYPKLEGFVPGWGNKAYQNVRDFYASEFGTSMDDIDQILDAGIMAGLFNGMQYVKGSKKLKQAKRGKVRPKRRQPTRAAPATAPTATRTKAQRKADLDTITDLDSALNYAEQNSG